MKQILLYEARVIKHHWYKSSYTFYVSNIDCNTIIKFKHRRYMIVMYHATIGNGIHEKIILIRLSPLRSVCYKQLIDMASSSSNSRFCDVNIDNLLQSAINSNTQKSEKHAWSLLEKFCLHKPFMLPSSTVPVQLTG